MEIVLRKESQVHQIIGKLQAEEELSGVLKKLPRTKSSEAENQKKINQRKQEQKNRQL